MNTCIQSTVSVAGAIALAAAVSVARAEYATGYGPNPRLPPPHRSLLPTIEVAPATAWPAGITPKPAEGLEAKAFADGLDHPRWLYVLPNGDVLVAETNAPDRPEQGKGFMNWVEGVLTGFVDEKGNARGRPVGVAIDGKGALLVADDVGNMVWRVAPSAGQPSSHRQESG